MTGIQALRERRDALAKTLVDLTDEEKTPKWEAAHQEQYDAAMHEIDDIDGQIKRHNEAMAKISLNAADRGQISDDDRSRFTTTPGAQSQDSRALRAFLAGGLSALAVEDVQRMRARQTPDIATAMRTPQAAMSTTTGSEGGYTVATEYYRQLTEAMKAFGGFRNLATVIQTGTGAQMNFPGADATSEEGEIVGQNAAVTAGDTTFTNITMDVYKYSSKKIAVPFELLQDSMFDLDAYIQRLLALRIGRITAKHYVIGTGTGQPKGISVSAAAGKTGATGQTVTVTYDDLVDLEHSVDPIYRGMPGVGWLMHDDTVRAIRKIKDGQSRPIFVPGYDATNPGGAPDRLLGRPITVDQAMPVMAANAKSILFGDYKRYLIREVMDLTIFRMADSNFILNGQVGFVAFNRQGAGLIDVGGAVKAYVNSAT